MLLSVLGVKSLLSVNGMAVNADSWFLMVLGISESWLLRPKQVFMLPLLRFRNTEVEKVGRKELEDKEKGC